MKWVYLILLGFFGSGCASKADKQAKALAFENIDFSGCLEQYPDYKAILQPLPVQRKTILDQNLLNESYLAYTGLPDLTSLLSFPLSSEALKITTISSQQKQGFTQTRVHLSMGGIGPFSALVLSPPKPKLHLLFLHGHGPEAMLDILDVLGFSCLEAGYAVYALDFRAMIGDREEEELTRDFYMKGKHLIGIRVQEVEILARYLKLCAGKNADSVIGHSGGSVVASLFVRVTQNRPRALVIDHLSKFNELAMNQFVHCECIPDLIPYFEKLHPASSGLPYIFATYGYADHQATVMTFLKNLEHSS